MPIFAYDSTRFSAVVKYEHETELAYCREAVVINDVAATLPVGSVLGKVTATGKYKLCVAAAVDGSQVPAGILIADTVGLSHDITLVASTDTKALVIARGPAIVAGAALTLGTGTTLAAASIVLKTLGIIAEITA